MLKVEEMILPNKKRFHFEASAGEIVHIQGSNGIGKSLFFKCLSRLIPSEFKTLSLHNKESEHFQIELWRRQILYLPPEIHHDPQMTVSEFLLLPLTFEIYKNHKIDFDDLDLKFDLKTPLGRLSSGERQRLSLYRAIKLDPSVLLIDETFSHVDQNEKEHIFSKLKVWCGKEKMILVISHQDLSGFSSRNYCL
jgi:ABC-type multidrug transport system ATPase subunit